MANIIGFFCVTLMSSSFSLAQKSNLENTQKEIEQLVEGKYDLILMKPDTCDCNLGNAIGNKRTVKLLNTPEEMALLKIEGFVFIGTQNVTGSNGEPAMIGSFKDCSKNVYLQVIYRKGRLIRVELSRKNGIKYSIAPNSLCQ